MPNHPDIHPALGAAYQITAHGISANIGPRFTSYALAKEYCDRANEGMMARYHYYVKPATKYAEAR